MALNRSRATDARANSASVPRWPTPRSGSSRLTVSRSVAASAAGLPAARTATVKPLQVFCRCGT
jgi:hypothetical protein